MHFRLIVLMLAGFASAVVVGQAVATEMFVPGDLIVTRSVYMGTGATVTVGQTLPGGGTAIADGTYPNVFNNAKPDPSFGVTSPIFLDQLTTSGTLVNSLNVTAAAAAQGINVTTSFSSKSETAINLSTNVSAVTFMGYVSPMNMLDVSNSNTPGHVDPTNPVALPFQRAVVQIDATGRLLVTPVNAYSGNNGRAAILDSAANQYFLVGNAGNGSGTQPTFIVNNTGVQLATPGGDAETTVVGTQQGTPGQANGFQFGFTITQTNPLTNQPYATSPDKSGKDDNFRGETIFNNTLYVTKGSGSNGINTVYQVDSAGTLPTTITAVSTPITVLPGFNTILARTATAGPNPFGLWFANDHTLYVADEGDGMAGDAATSAFAGLEKWIFDGSIWHLAYTLQNGLDLGVDYTVGSYFPTATDGLRNITGRINGDGTVTIFGITSTVSASGDQGADPNRLVAITDLLEATSLPESESFTTLETAGFGEVLRGVSFAPVPEPSTFALLCIGLAGVALISWKRRPSA
jgi:hypothetical protein